MKNTIIIILTALMAFSTTAVAADMTVPAEQTTKHSKKKAEIKEVTFKVHLHCENCVKKVRENISFEKGVKDLKVTQHSIYIKYDASKTSEATLKAAIEKLGYKILEEAHDHN